MNRRILIIEDNEQNLYLMRFLLENSNYEVLGAEDGKKGVAMALSCNPWGILLDIQLPEMDGYAVATELRKHEELNSVPIIAVTSYAMVGDREKALASGANGYIEKPINPESFVDEVTLYLKKGVV